MSVFTSTQLAQALLLAAEAHEKSFNPTISRYTLMVSQAVDQVTSNPAMRPVCCMLLISSWNESLDWAAEQ